MKDVVSTQGNRLGSKSLGSSLIKCLLIALIIALIISPQTYAMRIISLSPSVTEILFEIGAGDEVVGVTASCDWPPEAKKKKVVAGVAPNFQAILSLNPDIVIFEKKLMGKYIPTFEKLGINYLAVETDDWKMLFKNILLIGKVTGHYQEAEELVTQLLNTYEDVSALLEECPSQPKVLVIMWANPIYTIGTDTMAYTFWRDLKTKPLALPGDYGSVNIEWIISSDPDYIIALGDNVMEDLSKNPFITSLRAWREGRVINIDPSLVLRGTPRMVMAFKYLAKQLHPKCFSAYSFYRDERLFFSLSSTAPSDLEPLNLLFPFTHSNSRDPIWGD